MTNDQKAQDYYDALADRYDQATHERWTPPQQVASMILPLTDKHMTVLDIGIGTGQSIAELYQTRKFNTIEGIDTSEKMLRHCAQHYPDVTLHHGDFLQYASFRHASYDLVICCGALEFIADIEKFFEKCRDLLAIKGHLVLTFEPRIAFHSVQNAFVSAVPFHPALGVDGFQTYRYDFTTLLDLSEQYGFKIVHSSLFAAYQKNDQDVIYNLLHLQRV